MSEWIDADSTITRNHANGNVKSRTQDRIGAGASSTAPASIFNSAPSSKSKTPSIFAAQANNTASKSPASSSSDSKPKSTSTTSTAPTATSKPKKHKPQGTQTSLLEHIRRTDSRILSTDSSNRTSARSTRKSEPSNAQASSSARKRGRASEPVRAYSGHASSSDDEDSRRGTDLVDEVDHVKGKGRESQVGFDQMGERRDQDAKRSSFNGRGEEGEQEEENHMRGRKKLKLNSGLNQHICTTSESKGQRVETATSASSSASTSNRRTNPSHANPHQGNSVTEDSITEDESFSPSRKHFLRVGARHPPSKGQTQSQSQLPQEQESPAKSSHSQSQYSLLPWQKQILPRMADFRKHNGLPPLPQDLPPSREEQMERVREEARIATEKSLKRFQGNDPAGGRSRGGRSQDKATGQEEEEYDHEDTLMELQAEAEHLLGNESLPIDNCYSKWDPDESMEMRLTLAREAEGEQNLALTSSRQEGKKKDRGPSVLIEGNPAKFHGNLPSVDQRNGSKRKRKTQITPPQSPLNNPSPLKDRLLSLSKRRDQKRILAPSPSEIDRTSKPKSQSTPKVSPVASPSGGFSLHPGMDFDHSYRGGGFSIINAPNPEESIISPVNKGAPSNEATTSNHVRFGSTASTSKQGPSKTADSTRSKSLRSRSRSRSRSKSRGTPRGEDEQEYARKQIQKHMRTLMKQNPLLHSPVSGKIIYALETQVSSSPSGSSRSSSSVDGNQDANHDEMEQDPGGQEKDIRGSNRSQQMMTLNPEILDSPSARREKRRNAMAASKIGSSPIRSSRGLTQKQPLQPPQDDTLTSIRQDHRRASQSTRSPSILRPASPTDGGSQPFPLRSREETEEDGSAAGTPHTSQTEIEPTPVWLQQKRLKAQAQEKEKEKEIDEVGRDEWNPAELPKEGEEDSRDDEDLAETQLLDFDSEAEEDRSESPQGKEEEEQNENLVETQPLAFESDEEMSEDNQVLQPGSLSIPPRSDVKQILSLHLEGSSAEARIPPSSRRSALETRFSLPVEQVSFQETAASTRNPSAIDSWNEVHHAWKDHLDPVGPQNGASSKTRASTQASAPPRERMKQSTLKQFGFVLPTKQAGSSLLRNGAAGRDAVPSSQSLAPFSFVGRDLEDELDDEEYGYGDSNPNPNLIPNPNPGPNPNPNSNSSFNSNLNGVGIGAGSLKGIKAGAKSKAAGSSGGEKLDQGVNNPAKFGGSGVRSGAISRTINRQDSESEIVYETQGMEDDNGSSETQPLAWDDQDEEESSPIRTPPNPSLQPPRPQFQKRLTDTTSSSDLTPLEDLEKEKEARTLLWSDSEKEDLGKNRVSEEEDSEEAETQPLPQDYAEDSEDEETQPLFSSQGFDLDEEEVAFIPTPRTLTRASAKKLQQSQAKKSAAHLLHSSPTRKSRKNPGEQAGKNRNICNISSSSLSSPLPGVDPSSSPSTNSPAPRPSQFSRGKEFAYSSRKNKGRDFSSPIDSSSGSSQSEPISSLPSLNGKQPKIYANIQKRFASDGKE